MNIKKTSFSLALAMFTILSVSAQSALVEKSINGVQAGFAGAWLYNEFRLSNAIALRSEIGLNTNFDGSFYMPKVTRIKYLIAPEVNIQSRWYYNMNNRVVKGKDISRNSGNFFALKASLSQPTLLTSQRFVNIDYSYEIGLLATWGIRRNIGERFNYELGLGAGYMFGRNMRTSGLSTGGRPITDLHIRVGYKF
jgi:hypothetical protein